MLSEEKSEEKKPTNPLKVKIVTPCLSQQYIVTTIQGMKLLCKLYKFGGVYKQISLKNQAKQFAMLINIGWNVSLVIGSKMN